MLRPYECTLTYGRRRRDNFQLAKQFSESYEANPAQLRGCHEVQLHIDDHRSRGARQRHQYSMVLPGQIATDHVAHRDDFFKSSISTLYVAHEPEKKYVIAILRRRRGAFAIDNNDIGHTTLSEEWIGTTNNLPFKKRSRPIPYARSVVEKEKELLCLLARNTFHWHIQDFGPIRPPS